MGRPAPPPEGRRLRPGRVLSDHLLLRWCQQSAIGEAWVASPASLAIAPALASDLTRSAIALDALLRRLADGLLAHDPGPDGPGSSRLSPRQRHLCARPARRSVFLGALRHLRAGRRGARRARVQLRQAGRAAGDLGRGRDRPGTGQPESRRADALPACPRDPLGVDTAEAHGGAHVSPSSATPLTARSSGSRTCSAARRGPSAGNGRSWTLTP
jgi:hypothetical protein